jgi:hypothetical protein
MFPCEMARYIAGFRREARKYGPFQPHAVVMRPHLRTSEPGARISADAHFTPEHATGPFWGGCTLLHSTAVGAPSQLQPCVHRIVGGPNFDGGSRVAAEARSSRLPGRIIGREGAGSRGQAALLEFFPAAARTGIVASNFAQWFAMRHPERSQRAPF